MRVIEFVFTYMIKVKVLQAVIYKLPNNLLAYKGLV